MTLGMSHIYSGTRNYVPSVSYKNTTLHSPVAMNRGGRPSLSASAAAWAGRKRAASAASLRHSSKWRGANQLRLARSLSSGTTTFGRARNILRGEQRMFGTKMRGFGGLRKRDAHGRFA